MRFANWSWMRKKKYVEKSVQLTVRFSSYAWIDNLDTREK